MSNQDNTPFVTKDRLIYILLAVLAFVLVLGISEKVTQVNNNTREIVNMKIDWSDFENRIENIERTVTSIDSTLKARGR